MNFGTVVFRTEMRDKSRAVNSDLHVGLAFIPPPPLPVQQHGPLEVCLAPFMVVVALHMYPDLLLPVSERSLKGIMTCWDTCVVSVKKYTVV